MPLECSVYIAPARYWLLVKIDRVSAQWEGGGSFEKETVAASYSRTCAGTPSNAVVTVVGALWGGVVGRYG